MIKKNTIPLPRLIEEAFDLEQNTIYKNSDDQKLIQAQQAYIVFLRNFGYDTLSISMLTMKKYGSVSESIKNVIKLNEKDDEFLKRFKLSKKMVKDVMRDSILLIPKFDIRKCYNLESDVEYVPFEPLNTEPQKVFPIVRFIEDFDLLKAEYLSIDEKMGTVKAIIDRQQKLLSLYRDDLIKTFLPLKIGGKYYILPLITETLMPTADLAGVSHSGIYETTLDGFLDQILLDRKGIVITSISNRR